MVARLYDRVANRYDADWGGIYAAARTCCVEQIARAAGHRARALDTVDLGVGTGNSLRDLEKRIALGKCTGLDLSPGMLRQAARKLGDRVELLRRSALEAGDCLPAGSADLVMCHFLLSFVAPEPLLDEAYRLLSPGGMVSLATSTHGSLRELHDGRFRLTGKLFGVRRALRRATTPVDHRHCLALLRERGFDIVDDHLQQRQLRFESFADVRDWALNSGWAASYLDDPLGLRIAFGTAVFGLARVFMHPLYPIEACSEISLVLARKPDARETAEAKPPRRQRAELPV